MKYYAVKVGVKTGIYDTWEECQKQTKGFSGAVFKSFSTKKEAEDYLNVKTEEIKDSVTESDNGVVHVYTDGSYNEETKQYGYGFVIVAQNEILTVVSNYGNDSKYIESRNISGEVMAVIDAVQLLCKPMLYSVFECEKHLKIVLHHDYIGLSKWVSGEWKSKKAISVKYVDFMRLTHEIFKNVDIVFEHVKGHTGDKYNELADKLAGYKINMITDNERAEIDQLIDKMEKIV
ncbi:MAG: ribonuclease H family protein [Oscillospiraceae bacterium]|nr:ribonuclease H family protein [Oscillospiraceae bacterium]